MRRVVIESPYAGDIRKNVRYARRALRHSLSLGEAPLASHLLYTQRGILKDENADERAQGIAAGIAWHGVADAIIFYADLGFSMGMLHAMREAGAAGVPIEVRYMYAVKRAVERRGTGALASVEGSGTSDVQNAIALLERPSIFDDPSSG